jgi:glycine dehydrogenase
MIADLERWLAALTGYAAVSLQPNAGSQGELSGLLAIAAYHRSRGEGHRKVCLIPASAHGTNAASAVMAGMRVVVVRTSERGDVDLADLRAKVDEHRDDLAALMITYPSTHGVYEAAIRDVCAAVHDAGGQVYVDGANLNALVGLARPGAFGGDVSHLNLHKTFCIPHGGGGPGVGPVAVAEHLAPFLPGGDGVDGVRVGAVSAAPYGSPGVLPISWMFVRMMGLDGLRRATLTAVAAANYVARRLGEHFPVLYSGIDHGSAAGGGQGFVAHECILDLRGITKQTGVTVDDVAKRLADYGLHAPTMSFPVAGTLMVEPTESEDLAEIDRFVDAMVGIRGEIDRVAAGEWPADDNPLRGAPHTAACLVDKWDHPYSRELAAYPTGVVPGVHDRKVWPPVRRIDGAHGDRNLVCSCPPVAAFAEPEGTPGEPVPAHI